MTTRAIRALRAGIAAGVATQVALLSHVLGGGSAPDALLLALVFTVSWIVCLALVGARLSFVRLGAAVALSQFAFHATFAVLGGASGAPEIAGHVHGAASVLPAASASVATPAFAGADPLMWVAHALAAAVTTVVLFRGERVVRAAATPLVEFVHLVVRVVLALPVATRIRVPVIRHRAVSFLARVATSPVSRRGPPIALLSAN